MIFLINKINLDPAIFQWNIGIVNNYQNKKIKQPRLSSNLIFISATIEFFFFDMAFL